MAYQSRLDTIVGELNEYRQWLIDELARTDKALGAFEADAQRPTSGSTQRAGSSSRSHRSEAPAQPPASTSTSEMVLAVFFL